MQPSIATDVEEMARVSYAESMPQISIKLEKDDMNDDVGEYDWFPLFGI